MLKISENIITLKQKLLRLAGDIFMNVLIPSTSVKDINGNNLLTNYIFKFKAL